jgi:hypothetical protein
MKSTVQIFCEGYDRILKGDASLKKEDVLVESEQLHDLLLPRSRQRFEAQRHNLFSFAEWRFGLGNDLFFNLLESETLTVEPDRLIKYLTALIALLEIEKDSFPQYYSLFREYGPDLFVWEYELRNGKVLAGYDLCMFDEGGVWHDLRASDHLDGEDRSGQKLRLLMRHDPVFNACGSILRGAVKVAEIARDKKLKIKLALVHSEKLDVPEAAAVDQAGVVADEEQIRSYIKTVDQIPIPTPDEEQELVRKIELFGEEGAAARRRLAQGYFRLVISLATKYLERGVRLLDLIPPANQALTRAVEQYDFASGIPFQDYATWQIEEVLQERVGDKDGCESRHTDLEDRVAKVSSLSKKLQKEKGRPPSEKELAQAMNLDIEEFRKVFGQA